MRDSGGLAGPEPVDKSDWGAGPSPMDKSLELGAGLQKQSARSEALPNRRGWPQPLELRGFGVAGPGPARPPSLSNPKVYIKFLAKAEVRKELFVSAAWTISKTHNHLLARLLCVKEGRREN